MTDLPPETVERAAHLIYDRVGAHLFRVPFEDLGTEREAVHRHIGSSNIREGLYHLVRELAPILRGETT